MASLLKGYFAYFGIPISSDDEDEDKEEESPESLELEEDPFDTILNAYALTPNSLVSNRVVAELYIHELDYMNAINVAENGLSIAAKSEASAGWELSSVKKQFKVILATGLVHLFPPKHHKRALSIVDDVLAQSPDNVACLMARGYILQEAKKWEQASEYFVRVDLLLRDDLKEGLRAKEENAWCSCQLGDLKMARLGLLESLQILEEQDDRSDDISRCLWRIGQCCWKLGDEQCEEAYSYFIRSLKANSTYAPAFTSLGIYYSDFLSPPDPNRASKCFQKAFELDPREAEAARRLVEGFADEREWDLVEVVARRTIGGEGGLDGGIEASGGNAAFRYLPKNAWAWKAVGAVESHRKNYASAIEAFQVSLRAEPDDALSWLRLGEAYGKAGRHIAALKALSHAQSLQPDNWMCQYLIGEVQHGMGHFSESIDAFESVLESQPSEVAVLEFLCRAYLAQGELEFSTGFQERAVDSVLRCVSTGLRAIEQSAGLRGVIWKTIGDAIYALSNSSHRRIDVFNTLEKVVALIPAELEHLPSFMHQFSVQNGELTPTTMLGLAAAAYSYRLSIGSSETLARGGSAWFDLAVCLKLWAIKSVDTEHATEAAKQAIFYFKRALREDPGNEVFWVGLGHGNFLSDSRASQHAYIKALEIDTKNTVTWTNLGLLYLHHGDIELANEALYRAQTLDPDCSAAWIGQALVATEHNHLKEAIAMLEHAVTLTGCAPEGDVEFASRLFSRLRPSRGNEKESFEALLPGFFILDRYCRARPSDPTGLHLFGLVCERLGHFERGMALVARAIANLESTYEETEDAEVERRFTIANITLGRLCLALGDYARSGEACESALGLLADEDGEDVDSATRLLRSQARFGLGLASFMQGDLEKAVGNIEAAVESPGEDATVRGHMIILLAQTMWAIGTDEFKETAKAQLLDCISADAENLSAINTLAGMGVLTDDESLVDAALSEILGLPTEKRHKLDPGRDVDYLLTEYHVSQGHFKKALSVSQNALFTERSSAEVRNRLGTLLLQGGHAASALAVLSTLPKETQLSVLPESLHLRAIATSLDGSANDSGMRDMQKAIMLSPWNIQHWKGLAVVRAARENRDDH